MEVILVLASLVSLVAGLKCHISLDLGIKWTVDCSAMNFSSAPSPMIIHPVVVLNMSRNVFVHLKESQFINWTDILHLDLSTNFIKNVDDNAFKGLSNLTELNLMNNCIETLSKNITNQLPKLRILNLFSNKLKIIKPDTFQPVPFLLKLFLGSNSDLGKSFDNYKALNNSFSQGLITLDFANTSITELPDNFFNNANHLITLNIAQNQLKNIPGLPPSLRYLNISGTLIETVPQGLFLKSDALQKLSLEGLPQLRDIKASAFSGLSNLDDIYIKDCPKLSFISADAFGETLPELRKVTISHCALTTLAKTWEPLLSKAEYMDLQGNPWVCDGRISWIININILPNLTENLRCDKPLSARGMLVNHYFKPRSLHPYSNLIRAGIIIALVAILVASVVEMVRHRTKRKAKTYRQLQDISLQDRSPHTLPPL